MALESRDRVIGDHTYTARQIPCMAAQRLLVKLTKSLGSAFGALVDAGRGQGNFSNAFDKLSANIAEDELEKIIKQVFEYCEVDGKPLKPVFEMHFHGGNMMVMYEVVAFFLEVNFSDFLPVLLTANRSAQEAGPLSQSTSGGQSGG